MAEDGKSAENPANQGDKAPEASGAGAQPAQPAAGNQPSESSQSSQSSQPGADTQAATPGQPAAGSQAAEGAQAAPTLGRRRARYSHHTLFDIPIEGLEDAVARAAAAQAAGEEEEPEFQPGIAKDPLGLVLRVTYPDYSTREFVYSAGQVSEMILRDRDGKITARWFKNGESYTEQRLNAAGAEESPGRIWRGEISVDQNSGDVVFQPKHSVMRITERATDGVAYSENTRDGWAVSRARDGRVGRVDYSTGGFREFDYDPQGLSKITEGDGVTYSRQIDGSWLKTDSSTNASELCQERFHVNERGDMVYVGPGYQVVQRPDGTRIGCETDEKGRLLVVVVSHADEGESQFGYDEAGRLSAITWPDGTFDTRRGPASWRREPTGEDLELDQQVDFDGNIIAVSSDGVAEVIRPDGSARTEYPNGTREEHDRQGMMVWKMTPAQREIRYYAETGRYEYEVREGETLSEICRDNLRANDGTTAYEPAPDEITNEIERVQKLNRFTEFSELQAGQRIVLYEPATATAPAEEA